MEKMTKLVAIIYGIWCIAWLVLALVGSGESSISAHLWLALSGMPLAILSFKLQSASFTGILCAAILGWTQWVVVTEFFCRWGSRDKKNHGST